MLVFRSFVRDTTRWIKPGHMLWPLVNIVHALEHELTGNVAALNPVMKFSHIRKHWEDEYIDQANAWVQEEVS